MNVYAQELGGRIPLFDSRCLTAEQNRLHKTIDYHLMPWADSAGFVAHLPSGLLLGPFNSILASPEVGSTFLAFQSSEQQYTSLSDRVRQVVILSVGAGWKSGYERYAHSAVAKKVGLTETAIHALAAGAIAAELSPEEQIGQRFTLVLTVTHEVDDRLYEEAAAAFGIKGLVDLTIVAGLLRHSLSFAKHLWCSGNFGTRSFLIPLRPCVEIDTV